MKHTILRSVLIMAACGVCAVVSAQSIPTIRVTTQNNQAPASSNDPGCQGYSSCGMAGGGGSSFRYVAVTNFQLENAGQYNLTRANQPDSIRLRGNSTAGANKKPYRIKFDKKTSLFGKEAAKSWVLLANYYDHTFALNAIAFELGKRLRLENTYTTQFVNLFLNGQYQGIYHLTEQIQVNPGRVDIDEDFGWLVEFDYHAPASDKCPAFFTTNRYCLNSRVRSPEDLPISSDYDWVKRDVNRLVDSMYSNNFPNNGYRDQIDLESVAKYLLIQTLMDNFDFNNKTLAGGLPGSNYFYKDVGGKIKAGPLWDFDLAAGVTMNNFPRHYQTTTDSIRPRHDFYRRFYQDEVFLAKLKKNWDRHQSDFDVIPGFIDSISALLRPHISAHGNNISAPVNGATTLTQAIYDQEIGRLKNWWSQRLQFYSQEINRMNIDTTKDICEDVSVTTRSKHISGSGVTTVKNGFNLNVANKADVRIFNLNGREIKKFRLTGGNHSIRFGDLPKGMYMARVLIDGNRKDLRMMVR